MPLLSPDFVSRVTLKGRGGDEAYFRDVKLTGFALRVRRMADGSLSKTWFVIWDEKDGQGARRRRKYQIGDVATFPAQAAREEAANVLQAIARGDDPAALRHQKRAEATIAELAEDYRAEYLPGLKAGSRKDYEGKLRRCILPALGERRVSDITTPMVIDFHRRLRAKPTEANRSIAVLSSMMAFAVQKGMRSDNPCLRLKRYRERARDHWLDEHDLPLFVAALARRQGPAADLVRFLTVSGWRVTEARELTWDVVDLKRMVCRLEDTKTGESTRALSTDGAALIERQRTVSGYVFSTREGRYSIGYAQVRGLIAEVCEEAGIPKITPHVLRHSAATWAAIAGAQAHEIKEAFGWKTLAMTQRYVSRSETLARRGAQRAADAMNVLQRPSAQIVEFKR